MRMATASAATAVTKSPTMDPNTITTPAHPTTFASLPREMRDEIYGLVLPHSQTLDFSSIYPRPLNSIIPRVGNCLILATHASGSQFAREACMMFFQNNTIRVSEECLPKMLSEGPSAELASCYMFCSYTYGVPTTHFDVKAWIRRITVVLDSDQATDGLADHVGLLLLCPVLREIEVHIWKYPNPLKCIIGSISNAFKLLEEKNGCRLTSCRLTICVDSSPLILFPPSEDVWLGENVFSGLKELEDAVRDKKSDL